MRVNSRLGHQVSTGTGNNILILPEYEKKFQNIFIHVHSFDIYMLLKNSPVRKFKVEFTRSS